MRRGPGATTRDGLTVKLAVTLLLLLPLAFFPSPSSPPAAPSSSTTALAASLALPGTLALRRVTETEEASASSSSLPALARFLPHGLGGNVTVVLRLRLSFGGGVGRRWAAGLLVVALGAIGSVLVVGAVSWCGLVWAVAWSVAWQYTWAVVGA